MFLQANNGGEAVAKRSDGYDAKRLDQHDAKRSGGHAAERVRQVRGLLLLALAALLFAVLRAGVGHVFTPGWWRLW